MKLTMVVNTEGVVSHFKPRHSMYIIKMINRNGRFTYSEYMNLNVDRIRKWL